MRFPPSAVRHLRTDADSPWPDRNTKIRSGRLRYETETCARRFVSASRASIRTKNGHMSKIINVGLRSDRARDRRRKIPPWPSLTFLHHRHLLFHHFGRH